MVREWLGSGCACEVDAVLSSLQPASDMVRAELGGASEHPLSRESRLLRLVGSRELFGQLGRTWKAKDWRTRDERLMKG